MFFSPGDPVKGVLEFGGVAEDLGGVAKKFPPPAPPALPFGELPKGGGEAGDGGPPLEELGGFILFSFCRLKFDQA